MPATAGRVRMPANNRVHSSAALQTHGIWQSAIGYDPYAPDRKDPSGGERAAPVPAGENAYDSFQGLLALAKIQSGQVSSSDEPRGACRRCKRVGHLPFQCRNFLAVAKEDVGNGAVAVEGNTKGGKREETHPGTDSDKGSDSDDDSDSDSDVDSEMERAIAKKMSSSSRKKKRYSSEEKDDSLSSDDSEGDRKRKRHHSHRSKSRKSSSKRSRRDYTSTDDDESSRERRKRHHRSKKSSSSSSKRSRKDHSRKKERDKKRSSKSRRSPEASG
ncbi:hypothetical protein SELMODRAFT_446759 [Selaginella moellendorffii]|uniref:CCHC-type domain-containing protein n=1 Tax=Selaginella moellendorffii TaxID=88036 RepID=D8SU28_SELML|nr:CAX-interacting protein 4 [Selaginella moellendorffii]EFJ12122.1 hypothetical protein SELMODRAFT_446759 [Selaginella moellendorffii]|eukprot:XP_002986792.1 CAX-interacting protein 4 [Selaginella moellendorffii]